MAAKKDIKVNVGRERDQGEKPDEPAEAVEQREHQPEEVRDDEDQADARPADEAVLESGSDDAPPESAGVPADPIAELEDRLLRTQAEFENYKKRTARQYEEITKNANSRLLQQLLEVADSFDRAMEHSGEEVTVGALASGMKMIRSQLDSVLEKNDVRPIEAIGQPFDPALHEAITQVPSDEFDEGIVALEITRGYKLGDKVLRFAQVGVSAGKTAPSDKKSDES